MAISVHRNPATGEMTLELSLPGDVHEGPVSVVGSFNNWTPGVDLMLPENGDTRSAIIVVTDEADVHFRYLGSGDAWFDDPDADEVTDQGSVVHVAARGHSDDGLEQDGPEAASGTAEVADLSAPSEGGAEVSSIDDAQSRPRKARPRKAR